MQKGVNCNDGWKEEEDVQEGKEEGKEALEEEVGGVASRFGGSLLLLLLDPRGASSPYGSASRRDQRRTVGDMRHACALVRNPVPRRSLASGWISQV